MILLKKQLFPAIQKTSASAIAKPLKAQVAAHS